MLKDLHDRLDAAVFDVYGWPVTLTDEQIIEKLVALNAERTRRLRPSCPFGRCVAWLIRAHGRATLLLSMPSAGSQAVCRAPPKRQ